MAELDPQLSQESTHAQLEEEGGANSNIIFLGPGCLGLAYKQGGRQKYKQSNLSPVVFRETLTKMDIEKSQYYCKEQNDDNVYSFINHRNDFKMFKTLH